MISTPGPDAERLRRIADNEALFRSVNERVQEINDAFAPSTDRFEIVCECGDIRCTEQISVSPPAYEAVRAESALFFVVPGHEMKIYERFPSWEVDGLQIAEVNVASWDTSLRPEG